MKFLKIITVALLAALAGLSTQAQVVRKKAGDEGKKKTNSAISERQQSFYEVNEPSDADLQ